MTLGTLTKHVSEIRKLKYHTYVYLYLSDVPVYLNFDRLSEVFLAMTSSFVYPAIFLGY